MDTSEIVAAPITSPPAEHYNVVSECSMLLGKKYQVASPEGHYKRQFISIFVAILFIIIMTISGFNLRRSSEVHGNNKGFKNGLRASDILSTAQQNQTQRPDSSKEPLSSPWFLSLVLIPPKDSRLAIQKQIDQLAIKGSGPSFPAHVTIVGHAPCSSDSNAERMVAALKFGLKDFGEIPCSFSSQPARFEDTWSQALIVKMNTETDNDNAKFLQICQKSRRLMNLPQHQCTFPPPANSPHVSLFYGVGPGIPSVSDINESISPFTAHTVALWNTTPSTLDGVSEWKEIALIDLL